MPRTLRPRLRTMLERANPAVATFVELAVPDAGKVLRRAEDQFLQSPDPLVSLSPALSATASNAGGLTLSSVSERLIDQFAGNNTYFFLPQEQGSGSFHGTVGWTLSPDFPGAILRAVTTSLRWVSPTPPDVALQIYKVHRTAGVIRRQQGTSSVETKVIQHSFVPLLQEPVVRRFRDIPGAALTTDFAITFDLTPYRLAIEPISSPPPGPAESGDLPEYFFEIQPVLQGQGNFVGWERDTTSARLNIAGIGSVREVGWQRANPDDPGSLWVRTDHNDRTLTIQIDVEQYATTSQAVYALTLPALPSAESTGRVVFRKGEPSGTAAALELSTAGSSGPWTTVADGDQVALKQTAYHARLTMTASADRRRAPLVSAIGVEFRTSVDLSPESTLEPMTQGVSIPFCQASVGEGSVTVVRTGRRDYRDLGAMVASQGPDTQLEIDAYVGSRHPVVTRADWFHTTRAQVSSRTPTGTAEAFSLLSIAKTLKRKIPARIESISSVHTVIGTPTTQQVQVSPNLTGASSGGNEYDGQGYYIRVRKSAQPGVETGMTFVIDGNTGVDKLDFPTNADPTLSKELPGTFAVGDEIEVHSARYAQPPLSWVNADPADVWWEILTLHLGVPGDRIGLADVGAGGRAGLPPKVTDRAPGDATTQSKLTVTLKITDAEDGDALIDQLSFIMGGATVEIAGQLVFRQIYALRDGEGRITVAPDPAVKTFDARDYSDLDTPTGREQRITVLACDYGVDTTSAAALPTATTNFVDVDALAAYGLQDVEGLGTAVVPDEIARWCFNAVDLGAFLASQLAQQVVAACSTGIRLWQFTTVDAHPELTVGDTVVLVTDRYTDYDPARDVAVKGMAAYPLVLVSTAAGGRRFTGFLQGLGGVVGVDVRGGDGTLQDNNPLPAGGEIYNQCLAVITASDDSTVTVTVTGTAPTGTPTVQLVAASTPATLVSGAAIGTPVASGSVWVFRKGVALSGDGGAQFRAVFAGNVSDDDFVTIPEAAPDVSLGQQILSNPAFANGLAGYSVYDNLTSGHVHHSLQSDPTTPNASGKFLRINVDSATTPGVTVDPGFGGFFVNISADGGVFRQDTYHKGAHITWRVRATIPVGYTIGYASNAIGGGTITPITPMVGTGGWFDYKWLVVIGTSGTFSSTGFWYLTGAGTGPIQWDVAQVTGNDANQTPREAVRLISRARVIASDATTVTVRYAAADPFPSGLADVTLAYLALGTGGVTPSSGGTVTPASSLTEAAGTYIDYTITRPAFTTGTGRVTFTASRPGYASDSDAVDIPAQEKTSFGPSLTTRVTYSSTTASIAYTASGGTAEVSINGGGYSTAAASPIVVTRPAVGSLPLAYDFRIVADGQTITAHADVVPVGFGPSLTVTPTVSPTAVSIAYTATGTVQLKIDSGAYGSPAASPISVTRDGSDHTYTFKATLDGQEVSVPVDIPALTGTTSAPSVTGVLATKLSSGSFSVSWGAANIPSGATYDIHWRLTAGSGGGATSGDSNGNSSSPVTISVALGASPEANVSVTAKLDGVVLASGGTSGPMAT